MVLFAGFGLFLLLLLLLGMSLASTARRADDEHDDEIRVLLASRRATRPKSPGSSVRGSPESATSEAAPFRLTEPTPPGPLTPPGASTSLTRG
jgi:hypothetical protein